MDEVLSDGESWLQGIRAAIWAAGVTAHEARDDSYVLFTVTKWPSKRHADVWVEDGRVNTILCDGPDIVEEVPGADELTETLKRWFG